MITTQLPLFPATPSTAIPDQPALPLGWKWVKLGEICEKIVGGGTPSTQKPEYWNGDIDWITSADIYGIKDIRPRKKISEAAIAGSTTNLLPAGSIIVVTRVGLGKLAVVPHPVCFSQDSQGLVLNKQLITTEYALWCLSEAVQVFKYESRGTTISGVTKKQLVDLKVALPPLAEQHRIVARIEELFSEIDAGVTELETALARLKIYRQAVLHHFLSNPDWERVKLGEISETVSGFAFSSGDFSDTGQYQVIRMGNIRPDEIRLNENPIFLKTATKNIVHKFGLIPNDLIITLTGTRTKRDYGYVAQVKNEVNLLLNQRLAAIRIITPNNSTFYNYAVKTREFQNQFFAYETGNVGQGNVSIRAVKDVTVPLPNLETQTQIVQEIEARLSEADALEKTLRTELLRAGRLRQSVLKQAFTGKLL